MYFTFLDYAPKFHRMIYTTNWIERLNCSYKRTFPMVLLALTNSPHRTKYISEKELEAKLTEILGANWRDFLYEYKKKLKGPPQTTQEID